MNRFPISALLQNRDNQSTNMLSAGRYIYKSDKHCPVIVKELLINYNATSNFSFTNFGGEAAALTTPMRIYINSKTYGNIDLTGAVTTTTQLMSSCEVEFFNGQNMQLKIDQTFDLVETDEIVCDLGTTLSNTNILTVRVIGYELAK